MNPVKQLFKYSKPVIRKFEYPDLEAGKSGDVPLLWDMYKTGQLEDMPDGIDMDTFLEIVKKMEETLFDANVVEDVVKGELQPIALVFVKNVNGWQVEPHVTYLDIATPRVKLRSYVAWMKKTKYRKDIGACLIRADKAATNLVNRVEKYGLVEYVGKIWGGRKDGNDYLYSVRCNRRN